VIVTPPEIFPLPGILLLAEFTIVPMLLAEVQALRTIFVFVPRMVVAAIPIIVPFFMMIVCPHGHCGSERSGDEKRG
jgi:hypothetical protein